MIVLPDAENGTIVSSFLWAKHPNATEGRTDRRTDRIPLAVTALCIASNADVLRKPPGLTWTKHLNCPFYANTRNSLNSKITISLVFS